MAQNKTRLWGEWLVLFALLPFVLWEINLSDADAPYHFLRRGFFIMMWILTGVILWHRRKQTKKEPLGERITWQQMKPVLQRVALVTPLLVGLVLWLDANRFLQFPRENTLMWGAVMLLYPLLSVFPQEMIYRYFHFERYAPLFGKGQGMCLMSALAFGHVHLLFNNHIAYLLSIAGGYVFALTYQKTRNIWLVCLEHSLYGQIIFTSGLGWYFYRSGAAIS